MTLSDHLSRLNRHEKRRKNTKILSILFIVGGLLLLFLLGFLIFGGNGEEKANTAEPDHEDVDIQETEDEDEEDKEDVEVKEKEDEEESDADSEDESDKDELDQENAEPSDDNVQDAYTSDWDPVGTEQEGEHTTQFDKGSEDWKEMERAASVAADLDENSMVTWYIEGAGEQQTIATVSDQDDNNTYRVFLTWVDGEGWQPTKVEVLKENDKK